MGKNTLIRTNQFTLFAILLAIGLVLHYLESLFSIPVAGFMLKIGLSNVVVLYYLVQNRTPEGILMSLSKLLLALFFSPTINFSNFLISLGGAMTSLLIMVLANQIIKRKIITISILGGIFHNLGQLISVFFLLRMNFSLLQIGYFVPVLIVLGTLSGFLVGSITKLILSKLSNIPKKSDYNNR
jgi:heptaprenyl diphosphate synthase